MVVARKTPIHAIPNLAPTHDTVSIIARSQASCYPTIALCLHKLPKLHLYKKKRKEKRGKNFTRKIRNMY